VGLAHLRALIAAIVAIVIVTPECSAHEIGTTQVDAVFRKNHTYVIDVTTAPQALLNKLEARAHQRRSPSLPLPELQMRLREQVPALAQAVDLRFGAMRVTPEISVLPVVTSTDPTRPTFVVVRLSGEIPRRATTVTWRYLLSFSAYALSLQNEGHGAAMRIWLDGDGMSTPFPLARDVIPPSRLEVARQYLALGFTHIVPYGLDHILFVLGLFLLSPRLKAVLSQVTAFTIAHSITLGLTIYGVVSLSPRIVEPMIALSIAYIAIENLTTSELRAWRLGVVFCFGLLHGMGFAGVLKELGLPRADFLTALVTFNIGVEAGQLTVIATALLLFAYWHQRKPWYRYRFVVPASVIIALTGIFWMFQRILAGFGRA
jgi:hypothetical protein